MTYRDEEINSLKTQVLSLTNTLRLRPPPTPKAAPPPQAPAPKATKPSFAAVAASGPAPPPNQWQQVTKKAKKVRPEPLFKPDYTKVNRELIIELSAPIPEGVTDYAIITAANKALASTEVVFCLARRTVRGNIILLTRPNTPASSAEAYSSILATTLQSLGCAASNTRANSRWTKLLVHGVPTHTTPHEMAEEIRATYPTLPTLAQTPRWLTTPATREGKNSSTMVIAFPLSCNLQKLGLRSMTLFNTTCRLEVYLQVSPSTQCTKCQGFGHPAPRCLAPSPRCAVCANDHLTSAHTCTTCSGGAKCTHPPIKCVNCPLHPGHRANDPACPTKAKMQARSSSEDTLMPVVS